MVCGQREEKLLNTEDYPTERGIPIELVGTHSLRIGGACVLALAAGYSETQIQKMGRWCGATFGEYIREQLACWHATQGHVNINEKKFMAFVNITGGT